MNLSGAKTAVSHQAVSRTTTAVLALTMVAGAFAAGPAAHAAEPGSISGSVTDRSGAPAVGVVVKGLQADGGVISATTAADGRYVLSGLGAGAITVETVTSGTSACYPGVHYTAPGDKGPQVALAAGGAVSDVNITVERGATLSGEVVDAAGNGLPGIAVVLGEPGSSNPTTTTDTSGTYALTCLEASTVNVVSASNDDYYSATSGPFALAGGQTKNVTITALRKAAIAGTVRDNAGRGFPGVVVTAAVDGTTQYTTTTDATGAYVFRLPAGSYRLSAQDVSIGSDWVVGAYGGGSNAQAAPRIVVAPGGVARGKDMTLLPAAHISGTVHNSTSVVYDNGADGRLLAPLIVAISLDGFAYPGRIVDQYGHFSVTGLPAGTYRVIANGEDLPDKGFGRSAPVTVIAGQHVEGIEDTFGPISATVPAIKADGNILTAPVALPTGLPDALREEVRARWTWRYTAPKRAHHKRGAHIIGRHATLRLTKAWRKGDVSVTVRVSGVGVAPNQWLLHFHEPRR